MHKLLYYSILEFQPELLDLLRRNFDLIELPDPNHDKADILDNVDVIFSPLGFYCGKDKIDSCPNLKVIVSNTTGVPHIDVEYAESKGITIVALHNEQAFLKSITATAEHTWGLLIALTRRIPWAFDSVKNGTWNRRLFPGKSMFSSMTLGIVGLGRLGKMVAKYGFCFGMKVRYYDPYVNKPSMKKFEKVDSVIELVANNDIITLHLPLNEQTERMFNKKIFDNFKKEAYLINTSRAEVVDFDSLLDALKKKKLAGAAFDVFEGEFKKGFSDSKVFKNHPLLEYARTHDNLLITPHIGGSTLDAWAKTEQFTIKKLIEMFN